MRELNLRKLHRYLGAAVAPLVLMQAASGLVLSLDILGRWQSRVLGFLEDADLPAFAAFWDAVLHHVHFGSGTVGLAHNLAVGLGLLGLALSGVLIFFKIMARTPLPLLGRARATPGAAPREQPVFEGAGAFSRRRVAVTLCCAAVGMLALDVYIFAASFRLVGLHVPQFYAASEVEIQTARSRAEMERLLAGDPGASAERVRRGLERAWGAAEAMLAPREDAPPNTVLDNREILPVEDPSLRRRIAGMAAGLRQLRDLRLEAAGGAPEGGTRAEPSYRRILEGLEASARGLAEALMDVVEQDKERFYTVHLVLFVAVSLFLLVVGTIFYTYEAGRARNLQALHAARDVAQAYERRFRQVIQQAADPLLVFDRNGRIVQASRTAAYLLGYPEEELLTLNISAIDSSGTGEAWERLWAETVPGAPVAARTQWRHRDGRDIPVVLSLAVVASAEDGAEEPLMLAQARNESAGGEG